MRDAVVRSRAVELSDDRRFARRVRRLALVASVALGVIWALAVSTLAAPPLVEISLAAGWILMPTVLAASLARPELRYALVVPATLVGVGLLAICAWWLPAEPIPAIGWVLMTAGIALGGLLGLWFWFRLLPVPDALHDPFAPGRILLIGAHVGLIVIGGLLAALG
jgi:hypothetical protein